MLCSLETAASVCACFFTPLLRLLVLLLLLRSCQIKADFYGNERGSHRVYILNEALRSSQSILPVHHRPRHSSFIYLFSPYFIYLSTSGLPRSVLTSNLNFLHLGLSSLARARAIYTLSLNSFPSEAAPPPLGYQLTSLFAFQRQTFFQKIK